MKSPANLLFIITLSTLMGCGGNEPGNPGQSTLNQNRAVWTNQGIVHYTYDYVSSCFCGDAGIKFSIEVDGNSVIAVFNHETNSMVDLATYPTKFRTINDLFEVIQSALNANAASINVTYNKNKGFPESIYIDYNVQMADEEFSGTSGNLVVQ